MGAFSATVLKWVRETEQRQLAVFRESTWRLFEFAQTVRGAGGNMPVDTGFLRASFQASLGDLSFAVRFNLTKSSEAKIVVPYNQDAVAVVIANATINDAITGIWTANYAPYVEARHGFRRLAVQRWPHIVRETATELRSRSL